jgi:hypothetical protein
MQVLVAAAQQQQQQQGLAVTLGCFLTRSKSSSRLLNLQQQLLLLLVLVMMALLGCMLMMYCLTVSWQQTKMNSSSSRSHSTRHGSTAHLRQHLARAAGLGRALLYPREAGPA